MLPDGRRIADRSLVSDGKLHRIPTTTMIEGCTPFPPEFAARYRREGIWRDESIPQAIARAAEQSRESIALTDSVRSVGYGEMIDEAGRIAALLSRSGITAGDRIVVQLPNCIEFATFTIACLELGAIPIMALPAFRRAELEYLVSFSAAKAIAIAPSYRNFDHAQLALDLQRALPNLRSIFATAPADGCTWLREDKGQSRPIGTSSIDPFDVALFLLSGGTTGMPKLIPRTHADYLYNARESATVCGLGSDSRILIALPAEHNFPLACPGLLGAILTGARAIFCQTTQVTELAAVIRRERVTHLPCVPSLALGLLALPSSAHGDLASLRVMTVGGQRLQESTARSLKRTFPHISVQQVLGMAEGLLCFTRFTDSDEIAFTTQGRPLSSADEVRIVNADSEVPEGEVGELYCRGPYTIRGYFKAGERNREAFTADGYFRTGDLVRSTPSGHLIVEGRIKDLINRGGEKISAEEIESHLLAHRAVSGAAVVAMPDPALGERACAFLTLRDHGSLDLEEMRDFLGARGVARFKWPERIEVVEQLPLTNVGKVKKAELRRDIEEKIARENAAGSGRVPPRGE